jgi:hypothetical protein
MYHNRWQSELILLFMMHASDVDISSTAGGEIDRAMAAAIPPIQIHTSPSGVFLTQHYPFPPFLPRTAFLYGWICF